MCVFQQVSIGSNDENEQSLQGAAQECTSAEGLWSKKQVAEYLQVNERRVRTLVDRGDLPEGVLSKSRRYWDPEVIKAFRDDQPQQDADDDVNM